MRIGGVSCPPLFGGTTARPSQLVRVTVAGPVAGQARVRVAGPGVSTRQPLVISNLPAGSEQTLEVPVTVAAPHRPGSVLPVTAIADGPAERAELGAEITVAEPGWTMWMVSHFHYDPVWWDTQGRFTQSRPLLPGEDGALPEVRTAFELVRLHLDTADADPDYKFVLAEIDYLKPYFDVHPQDRARLRALLAAGRVEIVGGTYNEPNTNLTSAESTIRNAVAGLGYQRGVLGGDPASAWMLDAFGHDPSFPGIMAAAGLTSSAWARGPYHQWGPRRTVGANDRMQFPSEFEWISPDGRGLLTSYLANHYGAGWVTHQADDLAAAEAAALTQFTELAPVAATRNVLLPVGADHVIPSRWVTGIHRDWNARYVWPRFVTALPAEFFAAVRTEAGERGTWLTPQTRDMNPVYPGKDVSYIGTKQAQRAAEVAAEDGERLATLSWLAGADYPAQSLDKAWRLLAFGAHHDAITGTESDQVYLDLLAGWREAFWRGDAARRGAAAQLAGRAGTRPPWPGGERARPVAVFSTLSWPRAGLATVTLSLPAAAPPAGAGWRWLAVRDETGAELPFLAEGVRRHRDGSLAQLTVTFLAAVPALGYRTYWAVPADADAVAAFPGTAGLDGEAGWRAGPGTTIGNEAFTVTADAAAGGTLRSVVDRRRGMELLRGPGNELVLQEEYASHPRWGEGPWLLSPKGPGAGSASGPARVRAERCPIGSRLVAEFSLGGLRVRQETLLWDGLDRVEFRAHVDGPIGPDRLLRVRFPAAVPGGLPVYQCAVAVVGRPFGSPDADVASYPFTLDNPAHEWFGLGSAARVSVNGSRHAIGVAEVILPEAACLTPPCRNAVRSLVTALAAQGVTATCSRPGGPRYGAIDLDSNLPDVRIVLGGPEHNPWTARLLAGLSPGEAAAVTAAPGQPPLWLPASRSRAERFGPGADVRGDRDLPVLIVAGDDLAGAITRAAGDLADAQIEARPALPAREEPDPPWAGHSVALLNRGTPGSLVSPDGTLHIALMRACSAWPCGVWIDGERRTAPDGSSFAWQHWSHTFSYALAAGAGDWRESGFPLAGQEYNHDLITCETGVHDGPLPSAVSLCEVDSPAAGRPAVMLSALKPRGNPLAAGRPGNPRRAGGLTVRLRDAGAPPGGAGATHARQARLRLFPAIAAARVSDLLETADGEALPATPTPGPGPGTVAPDAGGPDVRGVLVTVPSAGIATVAVVTAGPTPASPTPASPTPPEPVQPVFARYWLHGKGPAPAGNLPVSVHLSPGQVTLAGPGRHSPAAAPLSVTVACGPVPAAGQVVLDVPAGLSIAAPDGGAAAPVLRYELPACGHVRCDLTVRAGPGTTPGRYFIAARIADDLGQQIEDVALVTVGEPAPPALGLQLPESLAALEAARRATTAELDVSLSPAALLLAAGQPGEFVVRLVNHTAGPVRGEAELIMPFGAWEMTGLPVRAFSAAPGEAVTLTYPVHPPATAGPGQWWALAKVSYFGRVRYSEASSVECRPDPGPPGP